MKLEKIDLASQAAGMHSDFHCCSPLDYGNPWRWAYTSASVVPKEQFLAIIRKTP